METITIPLSLEGQVLAYHSVETTKAFLRSMEFIQKLMFRKCNIIIRPSKDSDWPPVNKDGWQNKMFVKNCVFINCKLRIDATAFFRINGFFNNIVANSDIVMSNAALLPWHNVLYVVAANNSILNSKITCE